MPPSTKHGDNMEQIRKHGTIVTTKPTPEERIAALRRIVERGQYEKIDGSMIDLFSASAAVALYDAISEENRGKYATLTAPKMVHLAFKFMK